MSEQEQDLFEMGSDDESPRTRRRRGRLALLVSLGLVVVLVGGVAGVALYLQARIDSNIERIDDPFVNLQNRPSSPADDEDDSPQAMTFLLLGTDSRISAGDPSQWSVGAQRTDAIMLAQISADRDAVSVMSIPRDSWVEIPGQGYHKINAAFSFGGPALAIETIESMTDTRIDHIAIADFDSFAILTDELGGVEITLTQALTVDGTTLEPGTHLLDGQQALRYVRERYNVAGGDFGRVQRQQNWMRAIMVAAFDRDVLTNPGRLLSFLDAVSRSIVVDENLTIGDMRDLAFSARNLRPAGVTFITAPNSGTGWSPDGQQSIVILDENRFDRVAAAFADGTVHELLEEEPDIARPLGDDVS